MLTVNSLWFRKCRESFYIFSGLFSFHTRMFFITKIYLHNNKLVKSQEASKVTLHLFSNLTFIATFVIGNMSPEIYFYIGTIYRVRGMYSNLG